VNAQITYTIANVTVPGSLYPESFDVTRDLFEMNAVSGVITNKMLLNRDTADTYLITIGMR